MNFICWTDNFSLLCSAIKRAGYVRFFGGVHTDDVVTFYAPTNVGMLEAGLDLEKIEAMDDLKLRRILKSHIMEGAILAERLDCDTYYESMNDESSLGEQELLYVECHEIEETKAKTISGFYNDNLNLPVLMKPNDLPFCNGFIQPINQVIRSEVTSGLTNNQYRKI